MNGSLNAHIKKSRQIPEWVWFDGATALLEGQGVCYNWDYGDAKEYDAQRFNRVELPTILNAQFFAGVASRNYSAKAGGQLIEIYRPGSVCNILSKSSTTIGVGLLTCEAAGDYAGYFRYAGLPGEGSAKPMQTVDRSVTAGMCEALLQVGEPSGLVQYVDTGTGAAFVAMVGGTTILDATGTPGAHSTFTLADGAIPGLRKKFVCIVDLGETYNFVVTTTNALEMDGTELKSVVLDDIGDEWVGVWNGVWCEQAIVGATKT